MRRNDLSGAQEWMGAEVLMSSLIVCKLSARKTEGSWRLVMRSVFDGGVGICKGGIAERSIDIFALEARDVGREDGGEVGEVGDIDVCDNMFSLVDREQLSHEKVNQA